MAFFFFYMKPWDMSNKTEKLCFCTRRIRNDEVTLEEGLGHCHNILGHRLFTESLCECFCSFQQYSRTICTILYAALQTSGSFPNRYYCCFFQFMSLTKHEPESLNQISVQCLIFPRGFYMDLILNLASKFCSNIKTT